MGSRATTTSHTITGLTNGTEYAFELRAVNTSGDGVAAPLTGTITATPESGFPHDPPRDLRASFGNQQVTLSWRYPSDGDIEGYEYRLSNDGGVNWGLGWMVVPGSDNTTTSHVVTEIRNNTSYTFQLRAVSSGTSSGVSTLTAGARRPAPPPTTSNTVPKAVGSIGVQTLTVGGPARDIRLADRFRDADGDTFSYTAVSSRPDVVGVTVSDSTLTLTPVGVGAATITVTATDGEGFAEITADVIVEAGRATISGGAAPRPRRRGPVARSTPVAPTVTATLAPTEPAPTTPPEPTATSESVVRALTTPAPATRVAGSPAG